MVNINRRSAAAGVLAASIAFGAAACTGSSAATLPNATSGNSSNAGLVINPDDLVYRNVPGNEFQMTFTSAASPEGRSITIDPDDMAPVTYNGRKILIPRYRFMENINSNLPAVPGGPSPAQIARIMQSEEANTIDANSVTTLYGHLIKDHRVPQSQIDEAMQRCHPARGLQMP